MKSIKNASVKGKRVIVRVDFNVPFKDGKILDDNRIVSSLTTINYLVEKKAKVILLSHLGRVKTEEDKKKTQQVDGTSLWRESCPTSVRESPSEPFAIGEPD